MSEIESQNGHPDAIFDKEFQSNSKRSSYIKELNELGEYNFQMGVKTFSRNKTFLSENDFKPIISQLSETCQKFFSQQQLVLQDYDESVTRYQKMFENKQLQFEKNQFEIIDTFEVTLQEMINTYEELETGGLVQEVMVDTDIEEALQDFEKQQNTITQIVEQSQTSEFTMRKFINFLAIKCDLQQSLQNLIKIIQSKSPQEQSTNKVVDYTLKILQMKCSQLEKEIQLAGLVWKAMNQHVTSSETIMNELQQIQDEGKYILNNPELQQNLFDANSIIQQQLKCISTIEDITNKIEEEDSQTENDSVDDEDQFKETQRLEQNKQIIDGNQIDHQEDKSLFQKFMDEYCNKIVGFSSIQKDFLVKQNDLAQMNNIDQFQKDLDMYKAEIKQVNNIYEKYKTLTSEMLNSADQNKRKGLVEVEEAMKFFSTCQDLQKSTETWFEKMAQGLATAQLKQNSEQEQKLSESIVEPVSQKDIPVALSQQDCLRPVSRARKNLLGSLSLSQSFETKIDYEAQILQIFSDQFKKSQETKNLQKFIHDISTSMNSFGQIVIIVIAEDLKKTLRALDYNNKIQNIERQVNRLLQEPFSLNLISDMQDVITQTLNIKMDKTFKNKIQLLSEFKLLFTNFQNRPLKNDLGLEQYENNFQTLKTLIQKVTKNLK